MAASTAEYHSTFGGLWIDREDWEEEVVRRRLSPEQVEQVSSFLRDGFIILEQAAALDVVDAFQAEVSRSFRVGNAGVLYQTPGSQEAKSLDKPVPRRGTRVVDSFVPLPQALDLFASPRLLEFLNLIFGEDPLLFQSLSFDQGSEQGLHQDTAYVVVNRPLELAACWIALEDVQEGSGELMYSPGSHRNPDWHFGGDRKHWSPDLDGPEAHDDWARFLRQTARASDRPVETFLAKKGDILVWHADLAHGGSPVVNPELTRQSLVGHFCPQSGRPYYFDTPPLRSKVRHHGRLAYSSQHYDLNQFHVPDQPTTTPPQMAPAAETA